MPYYHLIEQDILANSKLLNSLHNLYGIKPENSRDQRQREREKERVGEERERERER